MSFMGGVFTNSGKNRIITLLNTDLSYGELGTSGTTETENDTNLAAAVTSTSSTVTKQVLDKQDLLDFSLPSTTAVGTTFQELGIFNSSGTLMSRFVFSSLTHASTDQWQFSTRLFFD